MIELTIPAEFVRAAQACQANKDTRYYLNGIHLTVDGLIHGTNGHILYQGKWTMLETGLESNLILNINGAIPATANTVTFYLPGPDETEGVCKTDNKKAYTFEVIDGKYPDVDRVIPKETRYTFSNGFACNPKYMVIAMKALGGDCVVCTHGGEHEGIVFTVSGGTDFAESSILIVMPVRDADKEHNFLSSVTPISKAA